MVKEFEALSVLCRQLAAAQRHGVPAQDVAALLAQDPQWGKRIRRLLEDLADALRTQPLPAAMATLARTFTADTVQLLRTAQERGALPPVLDALADDFAQRAEDGRFIRVSLTWPLWVGGVSLVVLFNLAVFVLPGFDEIYDGFNAALPPETSMLLALSRMVVGHAWLWAPPLAVLVVAAWRGWLPRSLSQPLAAAWDRLGFVHRHATSRFTLRLLRFGESQPELRPTALTHLQSTTGSRRLARAAGALALALQRGATPATALGEVQALPHRLALLAQLGERFGDPRAALDQLDQLAQAEAQEAATHYEQGCLLGLYAVLGVTVIAALGAVYLPIFKLGAII